VKASGIEVTAAKGGTWNAGGSENVGVTITYDGTETEPKIGDYYYSDGTWRDGGLRKLYADGTMEWAETKPQPENGKNVIAIVFHAGHHENDASDYSATGIGQQKCHGYAVALQDATNGYCQWGVYGTELGCCPTDGSGKKQNNYSAPDIDWSGYAWTQKIITAAGGKDKLNATEDSGYPATYYAVVDYAHKVPSPANSTGWFLPSIGQMWNVYQNRASLFEGKTVVSGLKSDWYWSSSEFCNSPARSALFVDVGSGRVDYNVKNYMSSYLRPVLAF
ncbi:fimbrillin family protein, partial [Phocaeicola vulgatus]